MKKLILHFIFLFFCTSAFSQKTTLRIRIIDTDSLTPIPFASISNNKGIAYLTDDKGALLIDWNLKDTMVIRALGYHPREMVLNDYNSQNLIRIELKAQAYLLPSATIKGISTKDDLKRAILKMRIKENPYADIKGTNFYKGPFVAPPPTAMNPISLIYNTDWAKRKRSKNWAKSIFVPEMK